MSTNRRKQGADCTPLKTGPNGRYLCRQCEVEVKPPRRTFCSKACAEEWMIRTSPGFLRGKVRERDHGVCALCSLDTYKLKGALRLIRQLTHPRYDERGGRGPLTEILPWLNGLEQALGIRFLGRVTLWDADHIKAVVDGGGECGLENIQTLCIWCHRAKTAALARRRAEERAAARNGTEAGGCSAGQR
jgi:5-methylcytosine-specific restriction protein A